MTTPGPAAFVEDVSHLPLKHELHAAAFQSGLEAADQGAAAIGADMGLAYVEQVYAEPLRPALVDCQILFFLDDRLQTALHQGEKPFGLFPGPVVGAETDGVRVVLFAVVQQAA